VVASWRVLWVLPKAPPSADTRSPALCEILGAGVSGYNNFVRSFTMPCRANRPGSIDGGLMTK